ncbi:formimidoylglutamase [Sphingobacterium psychroaquaticum]|uniref:formimidoylglutamase n=1 Tax=Sphingobacterium psychroaquaticum TaxID=561061 RepID=UPI00106AD0FB|nr:formimidoylglutamase [Sphingobacterium psychroaquaticum]QBQ40518.1 formimidoylglutamase [Sphingobacterium psychroaquaticum]
MIKQATTLYYQAPTPREWGGRNDGSEAQHRRWHQQIQLVDLKQTTRFDGAFVVLGFACEEGVARNSGRVGAAQGPAALRKALLNLPIFDAKHTHLYDAGNIICTDQNLEAGQEALGDAVQQICHHGGFPILLGGGHEITYGHYLGLRSAVDKQLGIINLDAHFDCRQPKPAATSGTGFYQIAEDEKKRGNKLHYLPIGIQKISNTKALFDEMHKQGITWIEAEDFHLGNKDRILESIDAFLAQVDQLYLTIDLDVFAAPYAPGVSAVAFCGIVPDHFFWLVLRRILQSPKLISIDIAELNPHLDIDMRTAKLGANLIFELLHQHRA